MALTCRSRTVRATPQQVWALIADPHSFPRWWPEVKRMEEVHPDRWTQVFTTSKGRAVRADFSLLESEPPSAGRGTGRRVWEQEVRGTPFEHVLAQASTEVLVEPAEMGTRVTICQRQKLRGASRVGGGLLLRRATRRKLDGALDGIVAATG